MINEVEIPAHVHANLAQLLTLRGKRRLTTKELQKLSGVREEIIMAYENGTGNPTKSKYNKLAEIFGWEEWN